MHHIILHTMARSVFCVSLFHKNIFIIVLVSVNPNAKSAVSRRVVMFRYSANIDKVFFLFYLNALQRVSYAFQDIIEKK